MSPAHRQYLVGQTIGGGVINLLLNAAIGYFAYRGLPRIPFSGTPSISGDLMVTAFVLPLLVCLIVTPLVRADVRNGKVAPAGAGGLLARLLPRVLPLRATALGLVAAAIIAPVTIWLLQALGTRDMSLGHFVLLKAVFGALLAVLVTPVVARRALMDPVIAARRAATQA